MDAYAKMLEIANEKARLLNEANEKLAAERAESEFREKQLRELDELGNRLLPETGVRVYGDGLEALRTIVDTYNRQQRRRELVGDPIVRFWHGDQYFLRDDLAIRYGRPCFAENPQAYSLFRTDPYGRMAVFAGDLEWAITESEKAIAADVAGEIK